MKYLYPIALRFHEKNIRSLMQKTSRDPKNPYYGKPCMESGIYEPGSSLGHIYNSVSLYLLPESSFYRSPKLLDFIRLLCIGAKDGIHEDGTNDLIVSNYHQADFFAAPSACMAYKNMNAIPDKTAEEAEVTEMIYALAERICKGLLASGFHTPNHRWVHTAALYHAYHTLREKDERYLILAKKYLAEKIDIDENGEFSERSAGMYSAISDRALCDIAKFGNMPELFEHVKKNLLLVHRFIEKESLIFTQNSRRKDKGEVGSDTLFDFDRYSDICLTAYANTHDLTFLQILQSALDKRSDIFSIYSPIRPFVDYPELRTLEADFSALPPLEEDFHVFYPKSNIVRVKEKGIVYSLLARNPNFLHVTVGNISISARMCSSFFAKAQFLPDEIEQIGEKAYRMSFHTCADYKLPFDVPPAGSEDYWSMDYKSRQSISRCDYGYTVDFTFTENGLQFHILTDGTENVPFKLEIAVTPGVHVRAGSAMTIGNAGNFLCASEGDIELSNFEGDLMTIKGAFAKHFYHKDMRGSIPSPSGKYLLYFTDFSPVDRTLEIICKRNEPWNYFTK